MKDAQWLAVDTETTGFQKPIFTVEIGAQKMRGWQPDGPSFRKIINHSCEIPPESSRVNGYTKEILERDGELPKDVYSELAKYGPDLPICAYNLEYDYDQVLVPEWKRLGIDAVSPPGFCLLKLTQRLLDPVPAGNCKLQTLRQYYRLPERGAHTALGDVETVIDLISTVLQPLIEDRELNTWDAVQRYTSEDWFPSRIAFGKYKGRHFQEALNDEQLLDWLNWLTKSSNARTVKMANWYLSRLYDDNNFAPVPRDFSSFAMSTAVDLVIFVDKNVEKLNGMVAAARDRLATLAMEYAIENNKVEVIRKKIFTFLKGHYRKRDEISLKVEYRQIFLDKLMQEGEEEAGAVWADFEQAKTERDRNYDQIEKASEQQKLLSDEESKELKGLFRKLASIFHPDRYANDEEMAETFSEMMTITNKARDEGDINLLREIAADPKAFMIKQGMKALDTSEEAGVINLQRLLESLQIEIFKTINDLDQIRESPDYEIWTLSQQDPTLIETIAERQSKIIDEEIATLKEQAKKLKEEIEALGGSCPT
jgi:DNA polymerase III epsilon subunit-like protein